MDDHLRGKYLAQVVRDYVILLLNEKLSVASGWNEPFASPIYPESEDKSL